MSKGFADAVKNATNAVGATVDDGDQVNAETTQATETGAASSALTTGDSLRKKAAAGAAKLTKVQQAATKVQVNDAVLQGRKDAKTVALAYAVGALDEQARAMSEVVLQLQAGRQKIANSTEEELVYYIEELEESDESESVGNLIAYSGRNGENSQDLNLLSGIF